MVYRHRSKALTVDCHGDVCAVYKVRELHWWERLWLMLSKRRREAYERRQQQLTREMLSAK